MSSGRENEPPPPPRREEILLEIEDGMENLRRWLYTERRGQAGYRDRDEARTVARDLAGLIYALQEERGEW